MANVLYMNVAAFEMYEILAEFQCIFSVFKSKPEKRGN